MKEFPRNLSRSLMTQYTNVYWPKWVYVCLNVWIWVIPNRENSQMLEFVENLSAYDGLGTEGLIRNKILAQNRSIVPIHGVWGHKSPYFCTRLESNKSHGECSFRIYIEFIRNWLVFTNDILFLPKQGSTDCLIRGLLGPKWSENFV